MKLYPKRLYAGIVLGRIVVGCGGEWLMKEIASVRGEVWSPTELSPPGPAWADRWVLGAGCWVLGQRGRGNIEESLHFRDAHAR